MFIAYRFILSLIPWLIVVWVDSSRIVGCLIQSFTHPEMMLTGTVQLWCIATKRFKPTYLGCNISIGIRNISNFFLARTRRAHITIFQDILPNGSDSHSSINLSLSRYVQEPFNCIASLKNRLGRVCYRKKRRSWNCRGEVRLVHHLAAIRLLINEKIPYGLRATRVKSSEELRRRHDE